MKLKLITPLTVVALTLCGCDRIKWSGHPDRPPQLSHRYEESVLLDHAAVDCWHWRPLPDSLSLLGYDGARYIARLAHVPAGFRYVSNYQVAKLPLTAPAKPHDLPVELRSGGGFEVPCDVVWDIFWIRKDSDTLEIHQRFEIIREKDGESTGVANRPVIQISTVRLPASMTSRGTEALRTLPVRFNELQNVYSVTFHDEGTTDERSGHGLQIQWYFLGGKP
jgi:hypothetical protein